MSAQHESPAVAIARAHVEAWSNYDFDTARNGLAADVKVTATTTLPIMPATDLTGVDNYMLGLTQFAQGVVPGSLQIPGFTPEKDDSALAGSIAVKRPPAVSPPAPGRGWALASQPRCRGQSCAA